MLSIVPPRDKRHLIFGWYRPGSTQLLTGGESFTRSVEEINTIGSS